MQRALEYTVIKLVLSTVLLLLLFICLKEYRAGLLENRANKLFPLLANSELLSTSPVLITVIDQLETDDRYTSFRHWQRGLLYEWLGGDDNLVKAVKEIEIAIEQRPGWPLWRDRIRLAWKLRASSMERTELLRRFRRIGDWNRQSVTELTRLYLPRWRFLSPEEQDWLFLHAPYVVGNQAWVEIAASLVSKGILPASLCMGVTDLPSELSAKCVVGSSYIH